MRKTKTIEDNIILSKNILFKMNDKVTRKNQNIFVEGTTDLSRIINYIYPNLQQCNCSYIVIDKEGTIQENTERMFRENGYEIKVLDVINPQHSNHYNPFAYIREEYEILTLVDTLTKNFHNTTTVFSDPFVSVSQKTLLNALMFYLYKECDLDKQNFTYLLNLLNQVDTEKLSDENYVSPLDVLFMDLEKKNPNHVAVMSYSIFKQTISPEKAKAIIINLKVNLTIFNVSDYIKLSNNDEMNIPSICLKPTVLYIKPESSSHTGDGYNILLPIFFTQLLETLFYTAETECERKRCPIHVRVMLDDFGHYGVIPYFEQWISRSRPHNISFDILINGSAGFKVFKEQYKGTWETIIGNCDTLIHFGGNLIEKELLPTYTKGLSINIKRMDKKQIKCCFTKLPKEVEYLKTIEEIQDLKRHECIIKVRGLPLLKDKVYADDYSR